MTLRTSPKQRPSEDGEHGGRWVQRVSEREEGRVSKEGAQAVLEGGNDLIGGYLV